MPKTLVQRALPACPLEDLLRPRATADHRYTVDKRDCNGVDEKFMNDNAAVAHFYAMAQRVHNAA